MEDKAIPFAHQVDSEFIECAREVCPKNPVICDIGSRDALEGIYLCGALEASECHIFEPNPAAIKTCEANIAKYGQRCNIFFNPIALSDEAGSVAFFPVNIEKSDNKDIGFSSMFSVNPGYASKRRGSIVQDRITVPASTLDSYFGNRERQPDLLWIDVEGAEKLVLSGGEEILRRVTLIHIEVSFRPMQTGKPLFWEIDEFFKERRFTLFKFAGVSRAKTILAIRKLLPNLPWRWNAIYCCSSKLARLAPGAPAP
ncbi:MAG: FkbM family methyltransferase [Terriglobia bacterium]